MSRRRAWAELARLSNAPTCVTNVLVGVALAAGPMRWTAAVAMSVSILLLYVAGMALNDAFDVERELHVVSGGLGYTDQQVGLDLSLRQQVSGGNDTRIMGAIRYYVQ